MAFVLNTVILGILVYCLRWVIGRIQENKETRAIIKNLGCLSPPLLENQRPLGIDRLEQIFRADNESRLMELFLFHFRQTGYTLKQIFLLTPAYGTVDPANLEAIMSTKFSDWGMGPRRAISFPMFGEGIFIQDGEAWKHSRDLLRPHFVHRQYEDLEVFRESVDELLDALPKEGGVVDLQPFLKSPDSTNEQDFAGAFNAAQEYVVKRFRLLDLYWLIGGKKFSQACSKVHEFADQIIEHNLSLDSEAGTDKKYDFLRSVDKSMQGDRELLRGQIVNILVAGRDTTACLLSWTLTELRNMKYLQNVLKETLRLYPSVPVNTRTSLNDTILPTGGGPDRKSPIFIKKGTAVAYSVYTMHRRPDLYGMDAEIYRPERWNEQMPMNDNPTNQKWGYLPFNGGPRWTVALTEAAYTVVRILRKYPGVKLPANEKVELTGVEKQTMTLVVSIKEGCNVHL
ncbi:uncharacterized protein EAF02_009584 [Botrytis sinoallii]|uniref:uncharacterized protein n=1 Tax=Botrytis sinoallii TaxID=1463999 RepID=UPI0018FFCCBE|nr:uncharacterized protein EAF02_009584 [Botrytis sinoallii]KAF7868848.1 hypothetical protein EAF02_009584 [Botrytis sinoallii]